MPLENEVAYSSRITQVENRKIYVEAEMHSLDGTKLHGKAQALFIHLKHGSRPSQGSPPSA